MNALLATSLTAVAFCVQAAQPLVTDDAAVVAPKTCQIEASIRSTRDAREYSAQPACNFTGNLELTIGAARAHADAGEQSSAIQLQAKSVLYARTDGTWSFGAAAGGARDTGASRSGSAFQAYFVTALASWYPRSDLEIDLNLGAANVYGSGTFALAGGAIQYAVVQNLQLLAEVFRDEPGRGKYQLGVRWIAIPDRFEAFVSYGNRFNGFRGDWSALMGIRVQTPAFLH